MSRDRFNSRSGEIETSLVPLAVSEHTGLGFYRAFCARFGVSVSGADSEWGPIEVWLPEGRMRWDALLAAIDYSDLRLVIQENPGFFASFATNRDEIIGEDEEFDMFPEPKTVGCYIPKLPEVLIQPRALRTVWTTIGPLSRGADSKTGNVTMFGRELAINPLTGKRAYVPLFSGNSVRGMMRDQIMGRWLGLLGVKTTDLPPFRAHALLSGGHVDKGADGAKVNNEVRSRVRGVCPPWDLVAGCIEQQIMSGRARVNDAIIVCQETAWQTYGAVNPGVPLLEWAESLPEACMMTTMRLETHHKHAEIPESDGDQMLVNIEVIPKGCQLMHSFQLWGIDGVEPVTQACFADWLEDFRAIGYVGAKNAHGMGGIAFDPYLPGPGTPELPDPAIYLDFVEKHKQEAIDWLMSPKASTDAVPSAAKPKVKRGKKELVEEPIQPDAAFEDGLL